MIIGNNGTLPGVKEELTVLFTEVTGIGKDCCFLRNQSRQSILSVFNHIFEECAFVLSTNSESWSNDLILFVNSSNCIVSLNYTVTTGKFGALVIGNITLNLFFMIPYLFFMCFEKPGDSVNLLCITFYTIINLFGVFRFTFLNELFWDITELLSFIFKFSKGPTRFFCCIGWDLAPINGYRCSGKKTKAVTIEKKLLKQDNDMRFEFLNKRAMVAWSGWLSPLSVIKTMFSRHTLSILRVE